MGLSFVPDGRIAFSDKIFVCPGKEEAKLWHLLQRALPFVERQGCLLAVKRVTWFFVLSFPVTAAHSPGTKTS